MRDSLNLDPEDSMLLQRTYDSFARSGALLQGEDREKYRILSAELSELTTRFGQNVQKELENLYSILIQNDSIRTFFESEIRLNVLLADMNKIIGEGIQDIVEF